MSINDTDTHASRFNIERYSNFDKLLRVTARVLLLYQRTPKPSFQTAGKPFIPLDVTKANISGLWKHKGICTQTLKRQIQTSMP